MKISRRSAEKLLSRANTSSLNPNMNKGQKVGVQNPIRRKLKSLPAEGFRMVVLGEPVAKARPRVVHKVAKNETKSVRAFTPKRSKDYSKKVRNVSSVEMLGYAPYEGPVSVDLIFYLPIPASWPEWKKRAAIEGYVFPTVKPDGDNLTKNILDAINEIVFRDDCQVVDERISKRYSDRPRMECAIRPLNGCDNSATLKELKEICRLAWDRAAKEFIPLEEEMVS